MNERLREVLANRVIYLQIAWFQNLSAQFLSLSCVECWSKGQLFRTLSLQIASQSFLLFIDDRIICEEKIANEKKQYSVTYNCTNVRAE